MSAQAHLTPREHGVALAHDNRWMNEKLYDAAARLTDEQRKRDLGAFFKSIHGTLNHLLLGDQAWLLTAARSPPCWRSWGWTSA